MSKKDEFLNSGQSLRDWLYNFYDEYLQEDEIYEIGEIEGVEEAIFYELDNEEAEEVGEQYGCHIKYLNDFNEIDSITVYTSEYIQSYVNFS